MFLNKKYACITLDVEEDYGDRVNEFNIYKDSIDKIEELKSLYDTLDVPVSAFITTNILCTYKLLESTRNYLNNLKFEKKERLFDWIKDNVDFPVRKKRVN